MVIQVGGRLMEKFPESLDDFFNDFPEIGEANRALTDVPHAYMGRDEVLFIKQREQATSDYRENQKVRYIGSHAALTCHICIMRHKKSGVGSIGHFDNFCCWQFGEESSAHRFGIQTMLDEIAYLSDGASNGLVEVTVTGGYQDARGDAAKNSMSLLRALHDVPQVVDLVHFCVGKYNTKSVKEDDPKMGPHLRLGPKTAILKGLALDLQTQQLFPAIFDWCRFEDFDKQIKDRLRRRMGAPPLDGEEDRKTKTALSTFKPKSLKNKKGNSKDVNNNEAAIVDKNKQSEAIKSKTFDVDFLNMETKNKRKLPFYLQKSL